MGSGSVPNWPGALLAGQVAFGELEVTAVVVLEESCWLMRASSSLLRPLAASVPLIKLTGVEAGERGFRSEFRPAGGALGVLIIQLES